jgi:hypothetical protein
MTKEQLLDLKEKIDTVKTTISEYTGQLNGMMKQLKTEFDCDTVPEAETKLAGIEKNIGILEKKINKGILELESQLNEQEEE